MTTTVDQVGLRPADQEYWQAVIGGYAPLAVPQAWGRTDSGAEPGSALVRFGDLRDGLRTLAVRSGASLGTVLLAAHLKVMSALTTERRFHCGVVAPAAPDIPADERTPGLPANTRLLPYTADTAATWRELVEQTRAAQAELWEHRCALAEIAAAAGDERLVEVVFEHLGSAELDDASPAGHPATENAPNDFALKVTAVTGGASLISLSGALRPDEAERLAGMYRRVLTAMAADSDGRARDGVLSAEETAELTRRWNPLLPAWQPERCVHEAFEAQARTQPDAVAVVFGTHELTYRQLNEWANRIAHHLRALGAGPDRLVGVCLERGPDLLPTLLGVLKSGAAYLPLDPANPGQRLGYILENAGVALLVTTSDLAGRIPAGAAGKQIVLDTDAAAIAARPSENPPSAAGLGNLAYVIYTSGSTGRPKGVMIPHGALANLIGSFTELIGTWLVSTSISFDISHLEIHLPLSTGGRIMLASREQVADPRQLGELIARSGVTHVQATPSGWRLLLDAGPIPEHVVALVGGEELPARLAADLRSRVARLVNVYGPTEATIWASHWEVPASSFPAVRLGEPLTGYGLHVLDAYGRPAPYGVPGELHIAGPGLARGYLGRPDLTAQRFVPDPFGPPGARLYRTGDLVRRLADGSLDFLGRIDNQVKIRGYRVELGEIEAALIGHPRIREAVVTLRENSVLAAHVVCNGRIDVSRLRTYLGGTLPAYMIPSQIFTLERMPLNLSGKVDRASLPWPDRAAAAPHRSADPTTRKERTS